MEEEIWNTEWVPYNNFQDVKKAVEKREATLSVAMDISRQWLTGGIYAPSLPKFVVTVLSWAIFLFGLFLLIYPFILHKYLYLLFIIPAIVFFFLMNPVARKMNRGCSLFFLVVGAGFIIYYFFWNNQVLFLLASLTVLIPYAIWEIITQISVSSAVSTVLEHEDLFIAFAKSRAIMITPNSLSYQEKATELSKLNEIKNPSCPNCKKEVPITANFCKNCGAKLKEL